MAILTTTSNNSSTGSRAPNLTNGDQKAAGQAKSQGNVAEYCLIVCPMVNAMDMLL